MNNRTARSSAFTAALGVAFAIINYAPRAALADDGVCQPTLQSTRTDFPAKAQQLGEHGTVQARVRIGLNGQAEDAGVAVSSGFATLDRAAIDSIRKYWRFDIAQCTALDLTREHVVKVRFEASKAATLSGTVDARAIAKTNELRANRSCDATESDSNTTVFSCINVQLLKNSAANLSAAK
jgi:TonB family protein